MFKRIEGFKDSVSLLGTSSNFSLAWGGRVTWLVEGRRDGGKESGGMERN